jgi:hypothetical protein
MKGGLSAFFVPVGKKVKLIRRDSIFRGLSFCGLVKISWALCRSNSCDLG